MSLWGRIASRTLAKHRWKRENFERGVPQYNLRFVVVIVSTCSEVPCRRWAHLMKRVKLEIERVRPLLLPLLSLSFATATTLSIRVKLFLASGDLSDLALQEMLIPITIIGTSCFIDSPSSFGTHDPGKPPPRDGFSQFLSKISALGKLNKFTS